MKINSQNSKPNNKKRNIKYISKKEEYNNNDLNKPEIKHDNIIKNNLIHNIKKQLLNSLKTKIDNLALDLKK